MTVALSKLEMHVPSFWVPGYLPFVTMNDGMTSCPPGMYLTLYMCLLLSITDMCNVIVDGCFSFSENLIKRFEQKK